ncbi:MAG TPA: hypothetical protein VED47_07855 [Burkholderiaceae bacterium]|nr:hypothetical protein [Burkholderiaceae bacterium]
MKDPGITANLPVFSAGGRLHAASGPLHPFQGYPWPDPYVCPDLPVTAVSPPPTPTAWYYCVCAKGHYPYVTSCPAGWQSVAPAQAATPR